MARPTKSNVRSWMKAHAHEHVDPRTGELNHTGLAEAAVDHFDSHHWLDDETHWVWDLPIKVAAGMALAENPRRPAPGVNITPEVAYWVRDPQGKWYSVNTEDAAFVLGTSITRTLAEGSYGKLRKRGRQKKDREVAELVAMPREYKKSDMQPGVGATLWTWDLGARSCAQVRDQIESRVREDLDRSVLPRYVGLYRAMGDALCGPKRKPNPSAPTTTASDLVGKLKF